MDTAAEQSQLQLIAATQANLSAALGAIKTASLSGTKRYLHPMCMGIADLAAGFVTLKQAGNTHAARVLIRTCIETTLKVGAVHEQPSALYRIAFTEHLGDVGFLKAADENQLIVKPEMIDERWKKISPALKSLFPGEQLKEAGISAETLAQWAKLPVLYDFYFKLYCNYTHGTLRAHAMPEHIAVEVDYSAVLGCLYAAIVIAGAALGANSPNFVGAIEELKAFAKPPEPPPPKQSKSG